MKNISDESCRENQRTSFIFNDVFSENRVFYAIMLKNLVESDRPHNMAQAFCVLDN